MYVTETILIVYQAWEGEGGFAGSELPYKKIGPEGPNKVGSAGDTGFMRTRAHVRGQDRPPLWSLQVGGGLIQQSLPLLAILRSF